MDFKYMYGKQADQYSFIHIPKMLVTEKNIYGNYHSCKSSLRSSFRPYGNGGKK